MSLLVMEAIAARCNLIRTNGNIHMTTKAVNEQSSRTNRAGTGQIFDAQLTPTGRMFG